ncbi:MAG: NAD-dependent epimerase/dehydratase family protein [Oscillatoriales cyanobacterium SM2_2_1]|nr:NAD-dependent epimerase/dehydratase family protein [Oscillatoriales cyanobacterium SM2_2_1]
MKAVVTGCAGFIGSHLCDRLLAMGMEVVGIDRCDRPWNLALALPSPRFHLVSQDLSTVDWNSVLHHCRFIFHLAAVAGVRSSWGQPFGHYCQTNIHLTQVLLDAALHCPTLERLVFASSSSVYGLVAAMPTPETTPPQPISPYAVTKYAAEQLVNLYHQNYGLPTVTLRFFTTYGPRQRSQMAFAKTIQAIAQGTPVDIYGDGQQRKDFVYVTDVVQSMVLAIHCPNLSGELINVGSGTTTAVQGVFALIADLMQKSWRYVYHPMPFGDGSPSWADLTKAQKVLGYAPQVDLKTGLLSQIKDWQEHYCG